MVYKQNILEEWIKIVTFLWSSFKEKKPYKISYSHNRILILISSC